MASIASALSARLLLAGGDEWFRVAHRRPTNWTNDAESALVVGFGGFLEPLISDERLRRVHVVDLSMDLRSEWALEVAAWTTQYPTKSITASTHLESASSLRDFDLISITGSTLCNGTLEYFLANARDDANVILQGQSASIHPRMFFEAGVNWVATTLKPPTLGRMTRGSHDGEVLRPILQGGLPWVYLLPRNSAPIS
jgi:hypothetical protein